ncbi:MAG: hypothetical protein PVH19_00140 [Planctomycetia bacterium]|jgi:hypothetical protein
MYTFQNIPSDGDAYRQHLIDRGYTFTAYDGDLERFKQDHLDVWAEVRDQMLAGTIVWDSERGGYWEAPRPTGNDLLSIVGMGIVTVGALALKHWLTRSERAECIDCTDLCA